MGGENFGRLTPQLFISFFVIKMARPEKKWLDYFSMDVEKDNKIKFLKAKFWLVWFAMYVELLQFIYKEWYYIEFMDDNMLLFMSETWLKEEETKLMLEFMLLKDLFNKSIFDKYWILTSTGIQKRYAEGTKKRNNIVVEKAIRIVWNYDHIGLKDTLTELKEELTGLKYPESTQSKVKESKVNKIKENNILVPEINPIPTGNKSEQPENFPTYNNTIYNKNIIYSLDFISDDVKELFIAFVEIRKKREKWLSDIAIKNLHKELHKLSTDPITQCSIINKSITNNRKWLFKLDEREIKANIQKVQISYQQEVAKDKENKKAIWDKFISEYWSDTMQQVLDKINTSSFTSSLL